MERKRVYLCLAHMSGKEMDYIKEAFDTNWVVPLGPNVNGFEKDLEEFVGEEKRVVALSSGTSAVHLSLIACGVGAGDEVMVQSFTFCASSNPVKYLGAIPVFVDSERDTWNMDPNCWMRLSLIVWLRPDVSPKPSLSCICMVCRQRFPNCLL